MIIERQLFRGRALVVSPGNIPYNVHYRSERHFKRLLTLIRKGKSYGLQKKS
jgi:hypothetical protein